MSDFSISYDGRRYRYESFRYDRLVDAIAHARSMQSRRELPAVTKRR